VQERSHWTDWSIIHVSTTVEKLRLPDARSWIRSLSSWSVRETYDLLVGLLTSKAKPLLSWELCYELMMTTNFAILHLTFFSHGLTPRKATSSILWMQSTPINTQRAADPLEKRKERVVVKMLELCGCDRVRGAHWIPLSFGPIEVWRTEELDCMFT